MFVTRELEVAAAHRLECENPLKRLDHGCLMRWTGSVKLDQLETMKRARNPKGLDQHPLQGVVERVTGTHIGELHGISLRALGGCDVCGRTYKV